MPRPSVLCPSDILAALADGPRTPVEMAAQFAVSRSTMHRMLADMVSKRDIDRSGVAPRVRYQLPNAPANPSTRSMVRLHLPRTFAVTLLEALNLYARLGIGQFREIAEIVRVQSFTSQLPGFRGDLMQNIENCASRMQSIMLGFAPGASHGMHGPHVQPEIQMIWRLYTALRHRMTWDAHPQGDWRVWADEPFDNGMDFNAQVFSVAAACRSAVESNDNSPRGSEMDCFIEMPAEQLQSVEAALCVHHRLYGDDLDCVVEMVRDGHVRRSDGRPVAFRDLVEGAEYAKLLTEQIAQWRGREVKSQAVEQARPVQEDRSRSQQMAAIIGSFRQSGGPSPDGHSAFDGSPPAGFSIAHISTPFDWQAFFAGEVPPGVELQRDEAGYRIVSTNDCDEKAPTIARSHSLQTAIQKARNVLAKAR